MRASLDVELVGTYVTLLPLTADDTAGLLAAASEDRSTFSYTNVPGTTEEMDETVRTLLDEHRDGVSVPLVTRDRTTGEVLGMTRYLTLRWLTSGQYPDAVEIGGTFLSARAQRTKVNANAKCLMLSHAFDVWGVQRVDLKTDERNERSRGAIERLGARFEGVLRSWQPSLAQGEAGTFRNSAMYSILPAEWPDVRAELERRLAS
jgi:N-acetyltransferase